MAASSIAIEDYPVPVNPPSRRLETVDLLRGLLMILMALDHTREYFGAATPNPTDPLHSWPLLFVTRWVTHLCAPGFIALAGTSVYLQRQRGKSPAQISKLLITRGLWLLLMEITVIAFGWTFTLDPFLQVIWAVGVSMIVLGFLQRLPVAAVGAIGAAIVMLHNLLDPYHGPPSGWRLDAWKLLHQQGMLTYHGQIIGFLLYPVLAWIGVICLGYAFGPLVVAPRQFRRFAVSALAAVFLAAFSFFRLVQPFHGYGDRFQFEHLPTLAQTSMSFWQVQKYPPSLEYVLATFGILLLLYGAFDWMGEHNVLPKLRGVIEIYGRVPFFYYVLHIYLLHTACAVVTLAVNGNIDAVVGRMTMNPEARGWGVPLLVVYPIWLSAVAILYWPCRWFSQVKARRRDWWLSYL